MARRDRSIHVSLVAIPDGMASTLSGIYEALNSFQFMDTLKGAVPSESPFQVEIVGLPGLPALTASGLPVSVHRPIAEVRRTDIVITPSVMVEGGEWKTGRYPAMVRWLSEMHEGGAMLCSACSGVLLLAETGLLNGHEATMHWAYARTFRQSFPEVRVLLERALVVSGARGELVMSGASASWHDLVLYLIARHVGPTAAQAIAKFLLLQWHTEGQAPYVMFNPPMDHDDAAVLDAQRWLADHFSVGSPVAEMIRRSGMAERSFKRRFGKATGITPIAYVQQLRVEEAKRRLERTAAPVDEISWKVGYEDPAFFRRLFKRLTGVTPAAYRRKFQVPEVQRGAGVPGKPPG